MAYPAVRSLPKLPLPLRPEAEYLIVGLLVRPVGHQAQSLVIALRSPATERSSDRCLIPHRSQGNASTLLGDAQALDGDLCLPRADEHCSSQVDVTRPHLLHRLPRRGVGWAASVGKGGRRLMRYGSLWRRSNARVVQASLARTPQPVERRHAHQPEGVLFSPSEALRRFCPAPGDMPPP